MKNIRSVFILLIGMISLTAFASTSKLDQKQKTEFKVEPSVQIEAVNVANDFQVVFVLTRASFFNNSEVKGFAIFINPVSILNDLGWKSEKQTYQLTSYHDKLLDNYNLNFKNQFNSVSNTRSR
jgi:uncharacterized pyridoxamine 5'-phosphate oxidase family protein